MQNHAKLIAGLENHCARKCTQGSNPCLSAKLCLRAFRSPGYVWLRRRNSSVGSVLDSHRRPAEAVTTNPDAAQIRRS